MRKYCEYMEIRITLFSRIYIDCAICIALYFIVVGTNFEDQKQIINECATRRISFTRKLYVRTETLFFHVERICMLISNY